MMFTSNKNVNATIFLNLPCTRPYVIAFSKTIFTWFSEDPTYWNGTTDAYNFHKWEPTQWQIKK